MSDDRRYIQLNKAFLYVDDVFLDIVEREKKQREIRRKKSMKAFFGTVAACFCLFMTLPVMAIAYNWIGLRDLLISGDKNKPECMTLLKYQDNPEIKALMEWQEFLAGYDTDQKIQLGSVNGELPAVTREDWLLYGVYSPEMGEKIDEIAERYGLRLHTEKINISSEALGTMPTEKIIEDSVIIEGCIYEDGSVQYEASTMLEGYGRLEFQFDYAVQGTFCTTLPIVGETENITEWQYISACGEPVLLISGTSSALILAELKHCLIAITVLDGSDNGITESVLQKLADKIDFRILKNALSSKTNGIYDLENYWIVTLSGYRSSPEAKAVAEWQAFLAEYDMGAATGAENSTFSAEGRKGWSLYAVYNYEMGEKLDEIVNRYGLKLYSEMNCVSSEEMEYRVGGNFIKDCTNYWGYIYEDGTFGFWGGAELDSCRRTDFQFVRSVKGTFVDTMLNIGNVEDYKEWLYVSACGEPVLLALGSSKALIFADFDKCFISVNILSGSNAGMTEEVLQDLADKIDFKILKDVKIPDMRGDSEIK